MTTPVMQMPVTHPSTKATPDALAPRDEADAAIDATPRGIHVIRHVDLERERYEEFLALPTDELRARAVEEIRAELALSPDRRREAVHTRLSAWLDMDPEDARIIARIWDEAAATFPADDARRRFEAECDAMLHGFRFDAFTRFTEFMPWVQSRYGLALFGSTATQTAAAA